MVIKHVDVCVSVCVQLCVCVCVLTHCVSRLAGSHTEHREGGVGALRGGGRRGQGCAVHLGIRLICENKMVSEMLTESWFIIRRV